MGDDGVLLQRADKVSLLARLLSRHACVSLPRKFWLIRCGGSFLEVGKLVACSQFEVADLTLVQAASELLY